MSANNEWAIGLGVVGGILLLTALDENAKATEQKQLPKPEDQPEPQKTKAQLEAERIRALYDSEHYPEAVTRACKLLFGLIREKSGIKTKDSTDLVNEVFSNKKPILRFTRHDNYPHLDTHEGYFFLLKGVSQAFRNPASHENVDMCHREASAQISLIGHLYDLVEGHTAKVEQSPMEEVAE